MAGDLIILKLGGSVLRSQADVPTAVHEIYRWYRAGWRVVATVATIGDATERLLDAARELADDPQPHAVAELLASGERRSAALLGIALDRVGVPARVVDPREVGLTVSGTALDSDASAVQAEHFLALLKRIPVLVISGFGYGADGRLQLLGRGGSDLSAIYLANALRATRCRLLKDVDGVYEADPATTSSASLQRFSALGYADALELAAPLIQPKAVRLLDRYSALAEVAAIASPYESVIGRFERTPAPANKASPTSVFILGLGAVGLGVYRRALAMAEHFTLMGVLVRDRAAYVAKGIDAQHLYDSFDALANARPDVVVDALPGLEPSQSLVSHFLERGVSVISTNTCVVAEAGRSLGALAARCHAYLRYSAAIGGSAPMLEALRREIHHGDIRSIAAVFGGQADRILHRCVQGSSFEQAVAESRSQVTATVLEQGLSCEDATRKLRILARHAFGHDPDALHIEPIDAARVERECDGLKAGTTLRLVARAWKISHRIFGQLQIEPVDRDDPLAQTQDDWNGLVITRASGKDLVVHGRRAGCWPITEAVMADLLDVRFAQLALANN